MAGSSTFASSQELAGGSGPEGTLPSFFNDLVILTGTDGQPRVTAKLDPNLTGNAKIVITDAKTQNEFEIVLPGPFQEQAIFERADREWIKLQRAANNPADLEAALEVLANDPTNTSTPLPLARGKNSKFDQLDSIIGAIPGIAVPIGSVTSNSLHDLLTGTEVFEIDMAPTGRPANEWGKMLVTIEGGEIFVTIQSAGAPVPTDRHNPNPTSITFNLGSDTNLGEERFVEKLKPIVEAFIKPSAHPGDIFAKSEVIDLLRADPSVSIQSIENAKLSKEVRWFNMKLAEGATLKDVEIGGVLGLVGDVKTDGVRIKSGAVFMILGPQTEFVNLVSELGSVVSGNLTCAIIDVGNCEIHGDWSNAKMKRAEFKGLEKIEEKDRLKHILRNFEDMDFSWADGPKLFKQHAISYQRNLDDDIKFKKQSNEIELLTDNSIYTLLQAAPNISTPTSLVQGHFAEHTLNDGTVCGPGFVTSMVNEYNEVGRLYLNSPGAVPSTVNRNANGYLSIVRANGEETRIFEISNGALLVQALYYLNSEYLKDDDDHVGTGKVKKLRQAILDDQEEQERQRVENELKAAQKAEEERRKNGKNPDDGTGSDPTK